MSTFFPNAQDFSIDGGTFSIIHGNQNNYYRQQISQASETSTSSSSLTKALGPLTQPTSSSTTTTAVQINGNQINQVINWEEKAHTEFDDFRNIKRGDIYRIRNICQVRGDEDCPCGACQGEVIEVVKTFCTAKLIGVEGEFTTVTYSGRDARKVFEREFLKLSRMQVSESAQVFAIDNGTIPSMVLWHNLIPLVQFKGKVGQLGLTYLHALCRQLRCLNQEVWIDSSRGVICRGPKGPYSYISWTSLEFKDLPPTAELLQDDVLVRFLASHKSKEADDAFIIEMHHAGRDQWRPKGVNQPIIVSALTKTAIAVANNVWKCYGGGLVERTCLENGLTRFRLDGVYLFLQVNMQTADAWLWQALSVFHAQGISLEENLKEFDLVYPMGSFSSELDRTPTKSQLRQQQPIYVFFHSPPSNPLNGDSCFLHYWSFQEDGHSQISLESCLDLGLPVKLDYCDSPYDYHWRSTSWPTDSYNSLHQYLVARGFDPTTTDFARHLGYGDYNFQPFNHSHCFKEVHKDQISPFLEASTDTGGFVNTTNSGDSSENMQDQSLAVDTVWADGCTIASGHEVPNKQCRADPEHDGIEVCNSPYQYLHHKNDTYEANTVMDTGLQLVQSLSTRNLPLASNPKQHIQQGTSMSTFCPSEYSPVCCGVFPQCLPLPTNNLLTDPFLLCNMNLLTSTALNLPSSLPPVIEQPLHVSHTVASNSFDIDSAFNSYSVSENAHSISSPITSMTDSPYDNPSAYLVSTTTHTGYEMDAGHDL